MSGIFTTKKELILASGSPRRQEYFQKLGLVFTTCLANINESVHSHESPGDFVHRMAQEKAEAVMPSYPSAWIVAADTIVCINDEILGKPADANEVKNMLRKLSGRIHIVQTGVCLGCLDEGIMELFSVKTNVSFVDLSEAIIANYIATSEPFDKAGGYGIQELGAFLVKEISGSYSNVVGLPLTETIYHLQQYNVIAPT